MELACGSMILSLLAGGALLIIQLSKDAHENMTNQVYQQRRCSVENTLHENYTLQHHYQIPHSDLILLQLSTFAHYTNCLTNFLLTLQLRPPSFQWIFQQNAIEIHVFIFF